MDTSLPPYSISPSGIACLLSTPPIPLLSLALKSIKINQILLCKDTIQCFRLTLELTETVECSCIDPPLIKIATSAAIPKLSKKWPAEEIKQPGSEILTGNYFVH